MKEQDQCLVSHFNIPHAGLRPKNAAQDPYVCSRSELSRISKAKVETSDRHPTRLKCHVRGEEAPPFGSQKPFCT
jgi:hypothetical protein